MSAAPKLEPVPAVIQVELSRIVSFKKAPKKSPEWALFVNSRTLLDTDGDRSLAENLFAYGQQQPIGIARIPKSLGWKGSEEFFVVWGHRRFNALNVLVPDILREEMDPDFKKKNEARRGWALPDKPAPTTIEAKLLDSDDPIEIAALNYRENEMRSNPHWTDRAIRIGEFADMKLTYAQISKLVGVSPSYTENLGRARKNLDPKLFELGRRKDGGMTAMIAFELAGMDGYEEQNRVWEEKYGGGSDKKPGRSKKAEKTEKTSRPSVGDLEAVLSDLRAGGYEEVEAKEGDLKGVKTAEAFSLGWQDGATVALRWAAGQRKTFPRAKVEEAEEE